MTVLVTGATGFLGGHVLEALRRKHPQEPIAVLVRDRKTWQQAPQSHQGGPIQVIEAGLTDTIKVQQALAGQAVRGILHLAAVVHHSRDHASSTLEANLRGTQAMAQLALANHCRLVFMSTSGTVGCSLHAAHRPDEDALHCSETVAGWPYYASKIAAERHLLAARQDLGLDAVLLRPPVMLGPGDSRFRATSLLVRFLRGRVPFYLAGGMHFIDVRDAAGAVVAALDHPSPRPIYHLCGAAMPLKAFFEQVARIGGVRAPKVRLPYVVAHAVARATRGKIFDPVVVEMGRHHWGLGSRYAQELDYAPRDPTTTLTETVAWLRSAHPALQNRRG